MKKSIARFICFGIAITGCTYFLGNMSNATSKSNVNAGICSIISYCINNEANVSVQKNQLSAKDKSFAANEAVLKDEVIGGYTNLGIANVEGSLNIRKEPSTTAELVGKLPADAGCEIISTVDGWYEITSGKVTGWVSAEFLLTGEAAKAKAKLVMKNVAKVTTPTLYVREQPTKEAPIVSMVANGEELEVIATQDGWAQVVLDADKGWLSLDYAQISQQLPRASTIAELQYGTGVSNVRVSLVQFALQYVGNRYVWGGTNLKKGIDCSGFTMRVYEHFGISLPHYSVAQAGYGTRIKASQAKPGDLFFYGSGKSISHVGIYMGNGQLVHASSPTSGIKISSVNYRTPICVIRLIND
jgi:peptidoglycan DL-endopeptidase CwlO